MLHHLVPAVDIIIHKHRLCYPCQESIFSDNVDPHFRLEVFFIPLNRTLSTVEFLSVGEAPRLPPVGLGGCCHTLDEGGGRAAAEVILDVAYLSITLFFMVYTLIFTANKPLFVSLSLSVCLSVCDLSKTHKML